MRNTWDVRSGRTPEYDIWRDELSDALARLGLDIGCLAEEPPLKPVKGSSLSLWEKEYDLWYDATVQFQREGTDLFDTVRHSMIISGPYAQIDVRAISMMKKGAIKDGRALLRWAFEFVDSSSLNCQMELVKKLNQKTIGINVNKCEFSDHMISLYEMWRQKEGANVDMPAEYFQRLLMSMPTAPEGPLVRVRSKIADLVEENSPILQNMDGEGGFFSRMAKYADSQGIKEGVEKRTYSREMGEMHAMHNQESEEQCGECMSWVCRKSSDKCICKHNSTFDIGKMKEGQKKEYIEMVRAYSKLNPGRRGPRCCCRHPTCAVHSSRPPAGPSRKAPLRTWRQTSTRRRQSSCLRTSRFRTMALMQSTSGWPRISAVTVRVSLSWGARSQAFSHRRRLSLTGRVRHSIRRSLVTAASFAFARLRSVSLTSSNQSRWGGGPSVGGARLPQ